MALFNILGETSIRGVGGLVVLNIFFNNLESNGLTSGPATMAQLLRHLVAKNYNL